MSVYISLALTDRPTASQTSYIHPQDTPDITTARPTPQFTFHQMAPLLLRHRAIITGASRGIGLSIARLFAQEGASCLLVARSEPALQAAVAELETLKLPVSGRGPGRSREDMGVEGLEWMEQDGAGGEGREGEAAGQQFGYVVGNVGEEGVWREVEGREVSSD